MSGLQTHARRLFLRAADERCQALLQQIEVGKLKPGRDDYESRKHAADFRLNQADAHYETARQELLGEIDRGS